MITTVSVILIIALLFWGTYHTIPLLKSSDKELFKLGIVMITIIWVVGIRWLFILIKGEGLVGKWVGTLF